MPPVERLTLKQLVEDLLRIQDAHGMSIAVYRQDAARGLQPAQIVTVGEYHAHDVGGASGVAVVVIS